MQDLEIEPTSGSQQSLLCGLTPSGQIDLRRGSLAEGPPLAAAVENRINGAFSQGRGHGVLHLGAAELGTDLDPTLGFWRDLGQLFVAKICAALEPAQSGIEVFPEPELEELDGEGSVVVGGGQWVFGDESIFDGGDGDVGGEELIEG